MAQPPHTGGKRGIVPGFWMAGITRRLQVHYRTTGRLLDVDKDTANHWLPVLGQHCQGVMNHFFRNLHLHECQLDESWTFIHKKEAHLSALEKLAEISGDAWVWIAFSPVYKLVPA